MRVTFTFSVTVSDADTDAELPAPKSLDGWIPTDDLIENYLDFDLADSGVLGGEIRVHAKANKARLTVTYQRYSPLHLAILYGHIEAARMLLAAGADPNRLDPQGSSPLQLCALANAVTDEQSGGGGGDVTVIVPFTYVIV
jgi:Ankyrin repeats (many copies)